MNSFVGDVLGKVDQENNIAVCVTTNGFVKRNGQCVMGRGIAKAVCDKYADLNITKLLGDKITANGNIVQVITNVGNNVLIAFPVKKVMCHCDGNNVVVHMAYNYKKGDVVPGWACKADIGLIEQSCLQLLELIKTLGVERVYLPRPGCGAGELKWEDVKNVLERTLDDERIIVCSL